MGGHGACPKCRRRLLLGTKKVAGRVQVAPSALGRKDPSGQTFLIENTYRIEDHFREIPSAHAAKISFRCPCYKKLAVPPKLVDRRVVKRIMDGKRMSANDLLSIQRGRGRLIPKFQGRSIAFRVPLNCRNGLAGVREQKRQHALRRAELPGPLNGARAPVGARVGGGHD